MKRAFYSSEEDESTEEEFEEQDLSITTPEVSARTCCRCVGRKIEHNSSTQQGVVADICYFSFGIMHWSIVTHRQNERP